MDKKTQDLVEQYAGSLVAVAVENQETQVIREDITDLLTVFDETGLATLLDNQGLSQADKATAVSQLKRGAQAHLQNFLDLIILNQRENLLSLILQRALFDLAHETNQHVVSIRSASPLSDSQRERLTSLAATKFGIEPAQVIETVDQSLIGGFVVSAKNHVIDTSIKSQLQQLKMNLK